MAINLTFGQAAVELQNIYKSAEYNELMKKRAQTTYLEAMGKQRSETIFSALLKWIIENPDFNKDSNSSPLMYLLRLLASKAVEQEIPALPIDSKTGKSRNLIDLALRNGIQANDIVVSNIKAKTEVSTYSGSGNGRIDLKIDCDVKSKHDNDNKGKTKIDLKLRVLLENKVDSEEGTENVNGQKKSNSMC